MVTVQSRVIVPHVGSPLEVFEKLVVNGAQPVNRVPVNEGIGGA